VAGTAAMFLVGGGILVHGVHAVALWVEGLTAGAAGVAGIGPALGVLATPLLNAGIGIVAGAVVLLVVTGVQKARGRH
jgi:predicted DNA repair protein MutK